jgi:methylated-DNA-protein-cysteine methyltransferase-like protein
MPLALPVQFQGVLQRIEHVKNSLKRYGKFHLVGILRLRGCYAALASTALRMTRLWGISNRLTTHGGFGIAELCNLMSHEEVKKKSAPDNSDKRARVVHCIRALPKGKVSTYGGIAKAAGWPGASRQVARVLSQVNGLPWYRVVGSGGAIKTPGEYAAEQRFRLEMEGVKFRGKRVNMKLHEHKFAKARKA